MSGGVAIVTGAAGDLGRGVCRALKKSGATVIALDVATARVESADRVVECDVTDPAACEAAVRGAVDEFGEVSTLVNLAQKWNRPKLIEVTDDETQLVFGTGPFATLRMMQLCYPHMKERGGGAVINFASASGTQGGVHGEGIYAGAKEAIRGITKHAAVEWGPDNIRVNALCPIATGDPNRWPASVIDVIPLGRLGDPEIDVGGLVVFLAGPTGSFITGRTLHVDGGAGMWR